MKVITLYAAQTNAKDLDQVVEVLLSGGVIIYPTDTLYAFGCDATQPKAVERLCALKGINPDKHNLSVVCADMSHLSQYARVSDGLFKMMKRLLPGAFTFLLPTTGKLPKPFKGKKTVGFRIPDHPITHAIVSQLGVPILSTSLPYPSDEPEYVTDPELIYETFAKRVDLIVDAGIGESIPSTVVDCTVEDEVTIVRQGKGVL